MSDTEQALSIESPGHARTGWSERLVSLDVFRGATIAGMLLVNNPGSWSSVYPPLLHAEWHGWTFTDLIFPFFLLIVGVTTHLSLSRKIERGDDRTALTIAILKRGLLIIALGLFLNAFPFFAWWNLPGNEDPTFLDRVAYRFEHLRIPGVLNRIGLAYIAGALLALGASTRRIVATIVMILVGFWLLMALVPAPGTPPGIDHLDDPSATISAWIDRTLLGEHLWSQTKTWDPEGILTTFPAIATVLLGVLLGRMLASGEALETRLNRIFVWGSMLAAAGLIWNWFFPINKNLWSSSYTLFTAGIGALTLATIVWIVDLKKRDAWTTPFTVFGVNPMLAFVGSGLMARFIYSLIRIETAEGPKPLQSIIFQTLFASWLPPRLASLAFAITFVLLWLAILWPLYRRRIVRRV